MDVGSCRLSLKLLLRMRKDRGTGTSSWMVVGSRAAVLLGLGPLLLPGTAWGVCLAAVLPRAVTAVCWVGTTWVLLLPLPRALVMGITVPAPAGKVGTTELLWGALVLKMGIQPLLLVVALAETGSAVLLAVTLSAELLLYWKFVVLPAVGKTVAWEETEVWVLLPIAFLEIVMLGAAVAGMVVVSVVVVSVVVVSVVVVSVVVVSVVVVSVVVVSVRFMARVPRGNTRSWQLGLQRRFGEVFRNAAPRLDATRHREAP